MWKKKGLILNINHFKNDLINSHASIPFAYHVNSNNYRIYFSSRNSIGKSLPYFIEAEILNGCINIKGNIVGPILDLGELGTFDDSGIMPSCIVKQNDKLFMYYIGWNPQVTVSYRLSIGLAISNDNGLSFARKNIGPICDRSIEEPFFNTAPFVILENEVWKMWYISCTGWQIINNYPEPSYHIKYAESLDGINWKRDGIICLDYDKVSKALGRPCVIKKNNNYQMYFSYRKINNYRETAENGYKIGFAKSIDGINWEKN